MSKTINAPLIIPHVMYTFLEVGFALFLTIWFDLLVPLVLYLGNGTGLLCLN